MDKFNISVIFAFTRRKLWIIPFVTKGYAGPEYFCDRVKETSQLVELTTNGNNIAL